MEFKITINCDNAAFEARPAREISRILKGICQDIKEKTRRELFDSRNLYDINGNKVGYATMQKSEMMQTIRATFERDNNRE